MTYYDSAKGVMITKRRAYLEFKKHGLGYDDFEDFLMEVIAHPSTVVCSEGNITEVDAQATLEWIGY